MNKKLLFIILSLIFLLSAPAIFAETVNTSQQTIADISPVTAEEYYNRGNADKKQGNLTQAMADYTKAIEIDSKHAKAYYNRGNIYGKQGNLTQAIADYTKAIEIDSKYKDAYYNRANNYGKQGNLSQAIADYTKAIELDPIYTAAYGNRGIAYQTRGNLQQAIADFNKAIDMNPKYAAAYGNRGNVYQIQGNLKQAIADYDKAIEISPEIAGFYSNRGNAYQTQGNLKQAIADYDKAIEINPNDNASYYNRGLAYYGMEQYEKSLADYVNATNKNLNKDAYEDFIKYIPVKKASDTGNVRNEILQLFSEKMNPDKKRATPAPVIAPVAEAAAEPGVVSATAPGAGVVAAAAAPIDASVVTNENLAQVNNKTSKVKSLPNEDIRNLVLKWAASWESGNMKIYSGCYASDFQSKGMNLNEWVTFKTNVHKNSNNIKINVSDFKISVDGNNAKAVFSQNYSSSLVKSKGKKTLELKKEGEEWKIFREIM
jgi:tetratricopeptide (TPR) repeat protein